MAAAYQDLLGAMGSEDTETRDSLLQEGLAAVQRADEHFQEGEALLDQLK